MRKRKWLILLPVVLLAAALAFTLRVRCTAGAPAAPETPAAEPPPPNPRRRPRPSRPRPPRLSRSIPPAPP